MSRFACSAFYDSDDDDDRPTTPPAGGTPSLFSTLPQYHDYYTLFSHIDASGTGGHLCSCCSFMGAIDEQSGYWTCLNSRRRWLIVDEVPPPMPADNFLAPCIARWMRAAAAGISWGELYEQELEIERSMETAAQRELRLAKQREAERQAAMRDQAARMAWEADTVGLRAKRGLKKGEDIKKIAQPCKKLYSCQGDKKTGGAKPTTLHVSSECWAHEYKDPVTKKKVVKHTCPWLHPGEAGWDAHWETDRRYMKPGAARPGPAAPAAGKNRFAALSCEGGGGGGGGGRAAAATGKRF